MEKRSLVLLVILEYFNFGDCFTKHGGGQGGVSKMVSVCLGIVCISSIHLILQALIH